VASGIYLEGAARAGGQAPDVAVPMLVEAALASWRYVRDPRLLERAVDLVPDLPPDSPLTPFVSAVRGLTRFRSGDLAAAFPLLRVAVRDLRQERLDVPRALMVGLLCVSIGDYAALEEVAEQAVAQCRRYGMVGRLVVALRILAVARVAGRARYDEAETMLAEALQLAVDTGQHRTVNQIQSGQVMVAALTGDEHQCRTLAEQSIAAATAHDDNVAAAIADWSVGLLDLGSGRYEQALTRLQRIDPRGHSFAVQFGGDLVEAAARAGRPELGADALAHVEEWAACSGEAWIRAVALRSQALVSSDEDAGGLYAAATGVAGEAGQPYEQARTDLVYGEWLRRARRRADARVRLRAAVEVFDRIGAAPWAGRARLELRATGETPAAGEPAPRLLTRLTPQERQVVVRAAAGASNREIAAELFLSHRTVGYHLYKAYPKLGITSRTELVRIAAAWSSD
jgi:DNA-binding CsgD family transcriptional regulator